MNHINLLPMHQNVFLVKLKHMRKRLYFVLLLMLFTVFIVMGVYKVHIKNIQKNILNMHTHISYQSKSADIAKSLDEEIKTINDKIYHVELARSENKNLLNFLNQLPQIVPEELYLVSLSWHEHTGVIYGQAQHHKTVTDFLSALKANAYFKHINLIKSDKRHENDATPPIYFVINFYE